MDIVSDAIIICYCEGIDEWGTYFGLDSEWINRRDCYLSNWIHDFFLLKKTLFTILIRTYADYSLFRYLQRRMTIIKILIYNLIRSTQYITIQMRRKSMKFNEIVIYFLHKKMTKPSLDAVVFAHCTSRVSSYICVLSS